MLDVGLPFLSGVEVLRAVRADPGPSGRISVLLLTASTAPELRNVADAAGSASVLRKPASGEDLRAAIAGLSSAEEGATAPSLSLADTLAPLFAASIGEIRRHAAEVARAVDHGELDVAADAAHRLAGLAAQFDQPAIAATADRLEADLRAGRGAAEALADLGRDVSRMGTASAAASQAAASASLQPDHA